MAPLSKPPAIKMLIVGDSGGGKTGALASLAKAGFNLNILDMDKGTEILFHMLKDDPAAMARVDIEQHTDQFKNMGGQMQVVVPVKAFPGALKAMDSWPGKGSPKSWGGDTVFVLDSLTFLGEAIFRYVLAANGKLGTSTDPKGGASEPNWGSAIGLQEDFLALLDQLNCHVIVMAHLTTVSVDGVERAFPAALGKKLPPKVGRYFNHTLMAKSTVAPGGAKRALYTNTQGLMELKSANPKAAKQSYPVETGLADYFKDMGIKPEA